MDRKRITAFLLSVLLLTGCAANKEKSEQEAPVKSEAVVSVQSENKAKETELVLAVGRDFVDTLPYQLKDEASLAVLPLMYESLVTVDETYHWQPELAAEIQQDGLEYTIILRDAVFSDGSEVRASDVVNSMNYARSVGSPWAEELAIVADCVTLTADKVQIVLTEAHQDFENLLTFPIIEEKNDGTWLGSGQYVLNNENAASPYLEVNPNAETIPSVEQIQLNVLPNTETLYDTLRIGSISALFDDLSSGEAMKLSERSSAVEIGHLLFLGVNNEEGLMADAAVRRTVSGIIDRQLLTDRVYASRATAASTPFHPKYYRLEQEEKAALNTETAVKQLEDAGLIKDAEGYFGSEEQSVLRLLYNSENVYRLQTAEMIAQQLEGISLKLELVGLPYADYMEALQEGEFDLYLGELAIDESMDISRLIEAGVGYGYGCLPENSVQQVYTSYQQGAASLSLFLSVYQQNMPAIPLLYRQGLVICEEYVKADILSNPAEAFAEIA